MNMRCAALAALLCLTSTGAALAAPAPTNTTAPPPRGTIEVSSWSMGASNAPQAAKDCTAKGGTVVTHGDQQACRMPPKSGSPSPTYGSSPQ